MTFEDYRDSIIEDFVADCVACGSIGFANELTEEQLEIVHEKFEEHRQCFNNSHKDFESEGMEVITSCIYGNEVSASIECMKCNSVIVDDESLLED